MPQDQAAPISKTHRKDLALEIFYQLLFVGLFMQNRRTDSMEQKVAGFFVYSILGVLGKTVALSYALCSNNATCAEVFASSIKDRRWQYLTSFILATIGWATALILTKGDLDNYSEKGTWGFFAGLSFDLAIFFAASDIKKVKELINKPSEGEGAQSEMQQTDDGPEMVTNGNEPTEDGLEKREANLPSSSGVTTTRRVRFMNEERREPSAVAINDDDADIENAI